jgi:hypothetical protein
MLAPEKDEESKVGFFSHVFSKIRIAGIFWFAEASFE